MCYREQSQAGTPRLTSTTKDCTICPPCRASNRSQIKDQQRKSWLYTQLKITASNHGNSRQKFSPVHRELSPHACIPPGDRRHEVSTSARSLVQCQMGISQCQMGVRQCQMGVRCGLNLLTSPFANIPPVSSGSGLANLYMCTCGCVVRTTGGSVRAGEPALEPYRCGEGVFDPEDDFPRAPLPQ